MRVNPFNLNQEMDLVRLSRISNDIFYVPFILIMIKVFNSL